MQNNHWWFQDAVSKLNFCVEARESPNGLGQVYCNWCGVECDKAAVLHGHLGDVF